MPLLCCNYTPHTGKTFVQHAQLAPHCPICAGVGWTLSLVRLPCLLVQQGRGMLLVWESFGLYTKEAGYGVSQGDV